MLSIMAGRTLAGMRGLLGAGASVVRAMPNTPAAVRQGVTVACPGPGVTAAQRALCDSLLQAIGTVAWVEDEALMADAGKKPVPVSVTAVGAAPTMTVPGLALEITGVG